MLKKRSNEEIKRWLMILILITITAFLLCGFILLLSIIWPFLQKLMVVFLPFLIAGFIIYLLHPLVEKLESLHVPRPLSILILFCLFIVVMIGIIMKAIPYVIQEGKELLEQIPSMANGYRELLSDVHHQIDFLPESFSVHLDQWIKSGEEWIADSIIKIGTLLMGLFDWILLFIVIPFVVFYGLKDLPLLKRVGWYITPMRARSESIELVNSLDEALGGYIRGQIIVGILVGLLAWIGFWIIDMPYGLLLAIFIGLTNIIPYFGPILGMVPVVLVGLTESLQLVFYGIILILVIQNIESNIFSPVIVGKSLHMHPLLIIFALVAGNEIAGIIGLILAVPVLAVIKVFILHFRRIIRNRKGSYD
ncbi:AI-2E family transporter [Salipaludibacillus sp. CF4.18]|uniref:AI-2E family transporter n=1 Tax=Salipaludibacillus sp. CF4.18 TaxID=3373081 RepID=UPI003EE7C048